MYVKSRWCEEGDNWKNELLDGKHFDLPEPEPGEYWTRDDYTLPEEGILTLTYLPCARSARSCTISDPGLTDIYHTF